MRLLVIGDIHAELQFLSRVLFSSRDLNLDGIVLAGDLGGDILGTKDSDTTEIRQELYKATVEGVFALLGKADLPIYFVYGNRDCPEVLATTDAFQNIDIRSGGSHKALCGYTLLGIGGSSYLLQDRGRPEKPKWYNEWTENEVDRQIRAYIDKEGGDIDFSKTIVVSHDPPWYTYVDRTESGQPVGSESIRALARSWQPRALLCGHIHECSGADLVGRRTLVVNAGSVILPQVTYTSIAAPSHTEVLVGYDAHFWILEVQDASATCCVEHFVCRTIAAPSRVGIEAYKIADGGLIRKTPHGEVPHPSTGSAPAPDKAELYEEARRHRQNPRFR